MQETEETDLAVKKVLHSLIYRSGTFHMKSLFVLLHAKKLTYKQFSCNRVIFHVFFINLKTSVIFNLFV